MDWNSFYLGFFFWLTSSGLLLGLFRSSTSRKKQKQKSLNSNGESDTNSYTLENSQQQQKINELEKQLAQKTQALDIAQSQIQELEAKFNSQQQETSNLQEQLAQNSDELKTKTIDFQRQLVELQEQVKTSNKLSQKGEDNWEQKQQKLQEKTAFYQAQITALQEELEMTSDQLELTQNKYFNYQQDLQQQISNYQDKVDLLQAKNKQLINKLKRLPTQLKGEWQKESIALLKELLVHYPTAKLMVELKHHLPSKNLIGLLKPLEKLLQTWEVETIGEPWKRVPYNPLIHDCGEEKINQGDPVYIRWVGYYQGDRVLLPAKVSRKLPKQRNRG